MYDEKGFGSLGLALGNGAERSVWIERGLSGKDGIGVIGLRGGGGILMF